MYKIVVKIDGQSNVPFNVFDMPEMIDELLEFITVAKKNPDKFRLEIVGNFVWSEKATHRFISFFEPIKRVSESIGETRGEGASLLMGFFQAMAMVESEDGADERLSAKPGNDIYD
jgi:hypothetical protein